MGAAEELVEWTRRVKSIVGLPPDESLDAASLPRVPWLLVPYEAGGEVDGCDLLSLYAAAGRGMGLARQIQRGEYRGPVDPLLPLLFAARTVARREARYNYYWPAFARAVLARPDTAVEDREALIAAWRLLDKATGQGLFTPSAGLRLIKWPLAHAGLLEGDESLLGRFVRWVSAVWGESELERLLIAPSHEFHAELADWIRSGGISQGRANLITQEGESGETISEVLQLHLQTHLERLRRSGEARDLDSAGSAIQARLGIAYSAAGNELYAQLEARTTIDMVGQWRLLDGERHRELSSQLLGDGRFVGLSAQVQLTSFDWPEHWSLVGPSKTRKLRLPTLDDGLILLDEETSTIARTWEPGRPYQVIAWKSVFDSQAVRMLFPNREVLGKPSPQAAFDDVIVAWARASLDLDDPTSTTMRELSSPAIRSSFHRSLWLPDRTPASSSRSPAREAFR